MNGLPGSLHFYSVLVLFAAVVVLSLSFFDLICCSQLCLEPFAWSLSALSPGLSQQSCC